MGEVSFSYSSSNYYKKLTSFRYIHENSKEYSIAYKRYVALSDASIFDSPVAITKVATGLSSLYDLFVEESAYGIEQHKDDLLHKESYAINIDENIKIKRNDLHLKPIKNNFVFKSRNFSLNLYLSYLTNKQCIYFNKLYNTFVSEEIRNDTSVNYMKNVLVSENIMNAYDYYNLYSMQTYKYGYKNNTTEPMHLFDNESNIYYQIINSIQDTNGLNVYSQYSLFSDINRLNIYHIHSLSRDIFHMYDFEVFNVYKNFDTYMSVYNSFYGANKTSYYVHELLNFNSASIKDKEMNIYAVAQLYKRNSDITYYKNIFTESHGRNIDVFNQLYGRIFNKKIEYYHHILTGYIDEKIIVPYKYSAGIKTYIGFDINDNVTAIKTSKILQYNSHILYGSQYNKQVFSSYVYGIQKTNTDTCYFDMDKMCIVRDKYAVIVKNCSVHIDGKSSNVSYFDLFATNNHKETNIFNFISFITAGKSSMVNGYNFVSNKEKSLMEQSNCYFTKDNKSLTISQIYGLTNSFKETGLSNSLSLDKYGKYFMLYNQTSITKKDKVIKKFNNPVFITNLLKSITIGDTIFVPKNTKSLDRNTIDYWTTKERNSIPFTSDPIYILKYKKDFSIDNNFITTFKDSKELKMFITYTEIYKSRIGFSASNFIESVKKERYPFIVNDDITSTIKTNVPINMFEYQPFTFKQKKEISSADIYDIFASKTKVSISIWDLLYADKSLQNASAWKYMNSLLKSYINVRTDVDATSIVKQKIPSDLLNSIFQNYAGMIIPISKLKIQSFIDDVDEMFKVKSRQSCCYDNVTTSVIPKEIGIQVNNIMCDKKAHESFIEYHNIYMQRKNFQAFIQKDIQWMKKSLNMYIGYNGIWLTKNKMPIDMFSNIQWLDKNNKHIMKDIDIWINGESIDISLDISSQMFMDKQSKMCYYDYDILRPTTEKNMSIHKDTSIGKEPYGVFLTYDFTQGIDKVSYGFYDYGVFGSKTVYDLEIVKAIEEANRVIYQAGIFPNDFGNWAWVYETPDPFEGDPFEIDELLLPERDTRYSDFKSIIFDSETLRPRNPIKTIDDTTFIAKYPTKHPIPDYEEIGIEYLDVRTEIMHQVYLKFYQIWQTKLFEFSAMTMTQSVKLMLDYLYSWIIVYYSKEDMDEALRVFRQIRWFAESAIIHNSQYLVSFEWDVLESKLTSGECHIPNNLSEPDSTMYVDSTLGVIRNKYWNVGIEASVTFTINNNKNSTFIFSLSNSVGSVNIYINDVLVDTLSRSGLNYQYSLPYNGRTNYVKIEKTAQNNINDEFFIGNIKIPDAAFKDLSVTFDPALKAGNKPLNVMAQKMLAFANIYDDISAVYTKMRKSNLGITETYKKMQEYWDIHHKDKLKGKRLTIKEV